MTDPHAGLIGSPAPLSRYDLLLFDLDGVVCIGPDAVPGAPEAIERAVAAGVRCTFVTNNASRRPSVVGAHLRELGVRCADDDVVTSAQGAAAILARKLPAGSSVLVVGGDGLTWALTEVGLKPVSSMDDDPAAVVQGFSPDVGWRQLAEGAHAVNAGLPFVATNMDLTVPTPQGRAPGNGALVGTIVVATGVQPEVAGKPEPTLFLEAVSRYAGKRPLAIGDRLDTDLEGARSAGIDGLMVLTGVHRVRELLAAPAHRRPHLIDRDLTGLEHEHPAPARTGAGWQVGDAVVTAGSAGLDVRAAGDDALNLLRAACSAAWDLPADRQEALDPEPVIQLLRRLEADGPWGDSVTVMDEPALDLPVIMRLRLSPRTRNCMITTLGGAADELPGYDVPEPPETGDQAVDEAVLRLAAATSEPLETQVTAFDAAHRALQDRLADVES